GGTDFFLGRCSCGGGAALGRLPRAAIGAGGGSCGSCGDPLGRLARVGGSASMRVCPGGVAPGTGGGIGGGGWVCRRPRAVVGPCAIALASPTITACLGGRSSSRCIGGIGRPVRSSFGTGGGDSSPLSTARTPRPPGTS